MTKVLIMEEDMEKKIHLKVDDNITLREVLAKIEEIQQENPEREVFFDGDEQAICSIPRKVEGKNKP